MSEKDTPEIHPSIPKMWAAFTAAHPEYQSQAPPDFFYFCDNKHDADECAALVVQGIKQATAGSLWSWEREQSPMPQPGDLFIVTNWGKEAKAIVRTTSLEHIAYRDITEEHAATEGEGDKSLAYWREVHWAFFTREMAPFGGQPSEDMIILFEKFETVWPE